MFPYTHIVPKNYILVWNLLTGNSQKPIQDHIDKDGFVKKVNPKYLGYE